MLTRKILPGLTLAYLAIPARARVWSRYGSTAERTLAEIRSGAPAWSAFLGGIRRYPAGVGFFFNLKHRPIPDTPQW